MRLLERLTEGRDLSAELKVAFKMTLAGSLSWWLGTLAGEPRPIFAALIPFVSISGDPFSAVSVSIARVLGVFAGVAIGIGLLHTSLGSLALVIAGLLAGTLVGIPLRVGGWPNVEPAVSALFLIAFARSTAFEAGFQRLWETAIGAGVAIAIATFLWPPDPARELRHWVERLRQELAVDLAAIAEELAFRNGAIERCIGGLREHSLDAVRDVFRLDRARGALRWNPLRRRGVEAFADLERRVRLGARLYRHTRAVARDVADADAELRGTPAGASLAAATRDLAEAADLALRGEPAGELLRRTRSHLERQAGGGADAMIVRAQLVQMLDDLEARA